eukprot:756513-Hanusia_phi.AAC.1
MTRTVSATREEQKETAILTNFTSISRHSFTMIIKSGALRQIISRRRGPGTIGEVPAILLHRLRTVRRWQSKTGTVTASEHRTLPETLSHD